MQVRVSILTLFLLVFFYFNAASQPNRYGVPIITNYEHFITGGSEQNWSITQDKRGVMYFGNQDKGILEYDGVEWRTIPIKNNSPVLSLTTGDDGVIYVGGVDEFGYLAPDCFGNMYYKSLVDRIHYSDSARKSISEVLKTYYLKGNVFFCARNNIYKYSPVEDSLEIIKRRQFSFLSFVVDDDIYSCSYGDGIMKLEKDSLFQIPGGDFFIEKDVSGMIKFDSTQFLIATFSNGIYLLDVKTGKVNSTFIDKFLGEYLLSGIIYYAQDLNKDFVLADVFNGLTIIDRNGTAKEIITEAEGLIDQQVSYVYTNKLMKGSAPVWIANFQGISKIETNNPFRVFTEKSGFEGFISDMVYFNDRLYISTSSGLFYKHSTSTGTQFMMVPDIQDQIWKLHHFVTNTGEEFLIVITNSSSAYVIDKNDNLSILNELISKKGDSSIENLNFNGYSITGDPFNTNRFFIGTPFDIYGIEYSAGRWEKVLDINKLPSTPRSIVIDRYNYLWTGTLNDGIARYKLTHDPENSELILYSTEKGLPSKNKNQVYLHPETHEVLIGTMEGIYQYDYKRDTIVKDSILNSILPAGSNTMMTIYNDFEDDIWISLENEKLGWTELVLSKSGQAYKIIQDKSFQRLPNSSTDVFYSHPENGFWFGKSNEIYHFEKSFVRNDTLPFHTLIRNVYINNDSLLFNGRCFIDDGRGGFKIYPEQAEDTQPFIQYRYNNIEFRWAAPFFEQEDRMLYSYWLEPFEKNWSDWTSAVYKDFTNLPHGQYTMRVRAMNVYGDISIPAAYSFNIKRPWYVTIYAYLAYIFLSGLAIYIIIKLYTRRLKQENIRLEGIIQDRTAEIRKQKEELTDSIEYASRIQRALLPSDKLLEDMNMGHFILFKPRDIVSGDFYWMGQKDGKIYVVAADCTGHGVPGAFMSMLGISFLDEIVIKSDINLTNLILDQLRTHVITSLKQSGKSMEESTKDGMDLAMVVIDPSSKKVQFSGAYNPLYCVRKLTRNEKARVNNGAELDLDKGAMNNNTHILYQIKGDPMPIGISEKSFQFTATELEGEGYSLYLFTDGFLDQFGGSSGKKFMSRNFKKLILEMQKYPIEKQGIEMDKVLKDWMGDISQIDDILVVGLQIN